MFYFSIFVRAKHLIMSNIIIGREKELLILNEVLLSNRPELVSIIGRRRVGKTFLIKNAFKNNIIFELTGIQNSDKTEQLQNFVFSMKRYFKNYQPVKPPESWIEAFDGLNNEIEKEKNGKKKVIFMDELPWLSSPRSGFLNGFSYFWNSCMADKNIVVVICGSAVSWMIKKVINHKGGLHNRVTRLMMLKPFTLAETEKFCLSNKIRLNRFQLVQLYMTMGGIPMYLTQLRAGESAVQNIQRIFFEPSGFLNQEFDRLFSSLFENYQNHLEVIKTLATKWRGMTRQEIINTTKFTNGGGLTEILEELEQSDFITVYAAYDKKTKESLYRLTDPYSLFYLTFMTKNMRKNAEFAKLSDLQQWKIWSGYAFENICLNHVSQIKGALSIKGISTSTATFLMRPNEDTSGTQIDLLIDRSDNSINICEMKFSEQPFEITKKVAENIEIKKQVFRQFGKTKKHLFTTLISPFGVVDNRYKLNHIDHIITMDDLFSNS